jgi:hypothetical protein
MLASTEAQPKRNGPATQTTQYPMLGETANQKIHHGFIRLRAHFLNQAADHFQQALSLEPDNAGALHLLGITLFKLGRREEGVDLIRRAADKEPRAAIWFDLAVALRESSRHAEAERVYANGIALLPPGSTHAPLSTRPFNVDWAEVRSTVVDYEHCARIRYGAGQPAHPRLLEIFDASRIQFASIIDEIAQYRADFERIPVAFDGGAGKPFWLNDWFPPLDGMALYAMLGVHRPNLFMEIGSGVSTRFARCAISQHNLSTRVVSIDPHPRGTIDGLVDEAIPSPLEAADPASFDRLVAGDVLFIDSSHRALQNSDVTAFFLDVLPRLKAGVIVQIHDIYLPYDYIAGYLRRMWNEQYLLATALLYGSKGIELLFPCWFASQDNELSSKINRDLRRGRLANIALYGTSFWFRKTN